VVQAEDDDGHEALLLAVVGDGRAPL
jgi:hypothetical protein